MKPRASKGINLAPKPAAQIKACRAGTVQAALIDLLVDGATLWELQGAAPKWSESSVKSALHWDVHHVKGYGIRTEFMTARQAYDAGHEASVEAMLGTEREHESIRPRVLPRAAGRHEQAAAAHAASVKGQAIRGIDRAD